MLAFPIKEQMDEAECYQFLYDILHPEGLSCPQGHPLPEDQAPHTKDRAPMVNYKCRECGKVFNIFSETVLTGIRFEPSEIVLMVRGFIKGEATTVIAQELDRDYGNVLKWRHRIQGQGWDNRLAVLLEDEVVEVDEVYQNSGHKGPSEDEEDQTPPRRRANKRRGRGTQATDRPPIVGLVGRETNQVRIEVCSDAQQETVIPLVKETTQSDATVNTDEAHTYNPLDQDSRDHHTVQHGQREWAKDEDGDGHNEVHTNTIEGLWSRWRQFMSAFRGVHQRYLPQYAVIFEWIHNLDELTEDCLRSLLIPGFTLKPI